MTPQDLAECFKIGDLVRIRDSRYGIAKVVEYRGPLGPKGAKVYRIQSPEEASACLHRSS